MFQKVTLIGNLGRDPEMRYLPSGDPVTNFSVATSEKWTDKEGNKKEKTIWWRISVFGKQAESCNTYLAKGSKVFVEGQLQADDSGNPRIWEGTDGIKKSSFEVKATTVKFLSSKGEAKAETEEVDADVPF